MKFALALSLLLLPAAFGQVINASVQSNYRATIHVGDMDIPFRFELTVKGDNAEGSFFNGEEKMTSTSGLLEVSKPFEQKLRLTWAHLQGRLEAEIGPDLSISGQYYGPVGPRDKGAHAFHATPTTGAETGDANAPSIGGVWIMPNNSTKGEKAWRFVVQQKGSQLTAAILRVDGDTGALTGVFKNGKFHISHFSGYRPNVMEIALLPDGTLDILQNGKTKLTAVRAEVAEAKGIASFTDPTKHTGVKDKAEAFRFSFPDLNGKLVSNTDPQFQNKVVLVEISGSWCPNCHDEAPFLVELYKKFHAQGLEIVTLSFEEPDQVANPERLRAFIKKYGIDYTVLLGGEQDDAKVKLTQTENWNAWPTTFFLGRDGRVRYVHAGFPSTGSGKLFEEAKAEFAGKVEQMLKEKLSAKR